LISNSTIDGSETGTVLEWTRNSDRKLLISWGDNGNASYFKLNEDTNRNLLQRYSSTMDITIPNTTIFDLLYIKNFFWTHTIDLSTFQRKTFKFHAGIDDITIKVGNVLSGNKIEIQGAAANVNLDIPNDIGVIMYYKHLLGIFQASQFDTLSGHYFQSQNIANSKATLQIYINLWAGNTKINRVDAK
jgi:predicted membrane protein